MELEAIRTEQLGHLGIVSATIKQLGLIKEIDALLPVSHKKGAKVTMGERVAAMILNGLGFLNDRLYMHSQFFENKPLSRLFRDGVEGEHFNDDALGDCLDAIYEYGASKLFSNVAFKIACEQKLLDKFSRIDTTSLSVYGDYEEQDTTGEESSIIDREDSTEEKEFNITYGYSKQKRMDLKQVILSLTVNGPSNLPLWVEGLSGNASDKKSIKASIEKIEKFKKQLKEAPNFIYVADSALYSKELLNSPDIRWITRVPETIREAKELCQKDYDESQWQKLNDKYKVINLESNYGKVQQRWQLVYSSNGYNREIATLEKKIEKEKANLTKVIKKLGKELYQCEADATKVITKLEKTQKYHKLVGNYIAESKHVGQGRPKAVAEKEIVGYRVEGQIIVNEEEIKKAKNTCGRFIITTNELDKTELPDDKLLLEYKNQSKVEKGFRFIKNNEFMLSSVYLKKASRIEALLMIMSFCLLVYNVGQYKIQKALEANKDTILNQVKKPTDKPTLRWIFRLIDKISVVIYSIEGNTKMVVSNLCETSKKIIRYFGVEAMTIYEVV